MLRAVISYASEAIVANLVVRNARSREQPTGSAVASH
jgi:hypothetical protein